MRPCAVRLLCVAVLVWLAAPALPAAQVRPDAASIAEGEPLPVPDWLAWTVLYDSLAFYRGRAAAEVEDMLSARVGLARGQAGVLFTTGETYVAALAEIETAASAEVQARYGRDRPRTRADVPPRPPAGVERPLGAPVSDRPITIESGTVLFDHVQASGQYAAVEAQKAAALAAHLQHLTLALGAPAVARLTDVVQTTVRPTIVRGVVRRPVPPPAALPPAVTATGTSQPPESAR